MGQTDEEAFLAGEGVRMKKALVLGGKLQGVEAAYLMKKAGWQVILMDKEKEVPAFELADRFVQADLCDEAGLEQQMREADLVIPALEKLAVLEVIAKAAERCGAKLMFRLSSYRISSSKRQSDRLFARLGVPAPKPWPDCSFPVIVKPSGRSGSEGVCLCDGPESLSALAKANGGRDHLIIQEYLTGPSYSIEIIAEHGQLKTFQVTELEMDEVYDCKRVLCPSGLDDVQEAVFADCAADLARAVDLEGIMDVEVILHDGKLKVLEIDARIPSQTLTAVYASTGAAAPAIYAAGAAGDLLEYTRYPACGVLYEHILVQDKCLKICGEHIMGDRGRLHYRTDFFGADEALTSYEGPGQSSWVATLLILGRDREACWRKHQQIVRRIMEAEGLKDYEDKGPSVQRRKENERL